MHYLTSEMLLCNICNMFFADFKHCSSHILNILFQRYCTSFYGSQLLPHFDVKIPKLYIAWRVSMECMACSMENTR